MLEHALKGNRQYWGLITLLLLLVLMFQLFLYLLLSLVVLFNLLVALLMLLVCLN